MEQNKYVIGVDGGNTKTDLSIADLNGTIIANLRKGTCSHEALSDSFEGAERTLRGFFDELHASTGIPKSAVASVALGLAGVDTQQQWEKLDRIVAGIGYPIHKVINDSYLSIHACSPDGTGICSINGTGAVAGGIDATGKMVQVGGLGTMTGDYGGGTYIAFKTVEVVYAHLFRNGPTTALTPKVLEILGVDDLSVIHERIAERVIETREYRLPLMQALFSLCGEDAVATEAVRFIAEELANTLIGCAGHLDFPGRIPVICAGSIWQKAETPLMLEHFCEKVQAGLHNRADITVLKETPVVGAVKWAVRLYQSQNA